MKVIASNGVKGALEELAPAFEREAGDRLVIAWGLGAALKREIEAGAAFDLAILASAGIDDLVKQGKIAAVGRAPIARSATGVGIRQGAPRSDIGTPEALKRTLRSAKSITWAREGAGGVYFAGLLERIGLADEMKPKTVLAPSGAEVCRLLAGGEAQYGVLLVNELMFVPRVEVLASLPHELQGYTTFHAGVAAASKNAKGATALIEFLRRPASAAVFKAKGQEPA
jgi:molybdate transport system substrate-binding protein